MTHPSIHPAILLQSINLSNDIGYIIHPEEDFESGIKRIIDEQVTHTIQHLTQQPDVHKGVHDARRCLKIIRAAWRLIREDLAPSDFDQKNAFYRDAARMLSEMRDLTALLEALEMMQKNTPNIRRWVSARTFKQALEERRSDLHEESSSGQKDLPRMVAEKLEAGYEQINPFHLSDHFVESVLESLGKVYDRGYEAYQLCRKDLNPETMHEWRKRSKYIRYQFHMLRNIWPNVLFVFEYEFHQLTDYLGDFNNLSVMKNHLDDSEYSLKKIYRNKLFQEAERQQENLGKEALHLGQRLYAERTRAFIQRLREYVSDGDVLK